MTSLALCPALKRLRITGFNGFDFDNVSMFCPNLEVLYIADNVSDNKNCIGTLHGLSNLREFFRSLDRVGSDETGKRRFCHLVAFCH
jgi:hypothetical protein